VNGKRQDDGLNRNQVGGTLGGPIVQNKLFFFGGCQGTLARQTPRDNISFVPTAAMVPVNPEGRRVAEAWDPARDEAAGDRCKAYGAPGIMSLPGRLRIAWENENTLRVDIDTGTQTRLFHFGESEAASTEPGVQGYSLAEWEFAGGRAARGGGAAARSRS
jgi:hypothetical protein